MVDKSESNLLLIKQFVLQYDKDYMLTDESAAFVVSALESIVAKIESSKLSGTDCNESRKQIAFDSLKLSRGSGAPPKDELGLIEFLSQPQVLQAMEMHDAYLEGERTLATIFLDYADESKGVSVEKVKTTYYRYINEVYPVLESLKNLNL